MKEYWNRPDATAETFDKGWFRTGDIAEIDEDGFIFIKDRIKDMIISGGENIYPAEVENVIIAHPAISEVAVIGLPDEKWGEIACAIVVGNAGRDQRGGHYRLLRRETVALQVAQEGDLYRSHTRATRRARYSSGY